MVVQYKYVFLYIFYVKTLFKKNICESVVVVCRHKCHCPVIDVFEIALPDKKQSINS